MNWLEYNHVHINCFRKTVYFSSAEEESGAEFLSTKQLKLLEHDGNLMFSLMAYLSVENQSVIDRLPVVNEFPEVFPDEISDVPPEREVEFSIIFCRVRSLCRWLLTYVSFRVGRVEEAIRRLA